MSIKISLISESTSLTFKHPQKSVHTLERYLVASTGINGKGAYSVIIKDNIVERAAGFGIAVSLDPFWWARLE